MTFEGFDAAPLIEAAGFTPAAPASEEQGSPNDATLDAALREAARGERAEATMLDLWIDRSGEANLRALESGTSRHAGVLPAQGDSILDVSGGGAKDVTLFAAFGDDKGEEEDGAVVKGTRPKTVDDDSDWVDFWGGGGGYPDGTTYGDGQGQVFTEKEISHSETCATPDGAAVQIADKIKATDDVYGPVEYHWGNAEYSAMVVATGDRYGAYNSTIYTYGAMNFSLMPAPGSGDVVEGIIHNHPDGLGNPTTDLISRYPGDDDWNELRELHGFYSVTNPDYDPSLWILGADGVVREFKYSEMSQFYGDAMTPDQKIAGEGLDERERTTSCNSS